MATTYDGHKNFASSTVATAPSPATTGASLVVAAGEGARFPTPPFNATVWPAGASATAANAEIVRVTGISTDTLTIARAQEGTTARSITTGDQIAATITSKTITDAEMAFVDNIEEWSHSLGFAYVANMEMSWPERLGRYYDTKVQADRMGSTVVGRGMAGVGGQLGQNGFKALYDRLPRNTLTYPLSAELAQSHLFVIALGIADIAMYNPASQTNVLRNSLRTSIARIRCSRVYEDTDATVTNVGTAGNFTNANASAIYYSGGTAKLLGGTAGDRIRISVPADFGGGTVVLGGLCLAAIAQVQRANIIVDSVQYGTWDADYSTDSYPSEGSPTCFRVTGLSPGAHTIDIQSRAGNGNIIFDWWGIEALDAPMVLMMNHPRAPGGAYTLFNTGWNRVPTDTEVANMNTMFNSLAAEFTDGKVVIADVDAAFGQNANYFNPDGVHWTEQGSLLAFETISATIDANKSKLPRRPTVMPRKRPVRAKPLMQDFPFQVGAVAPTGVAVTATTFGQTLARVAPFMIFEGMFLKTVTISTPATSAGIGFDFGIYDDLGVRQWYTGNQVPTAGITTITNALKVWLPEGQYYWAVSARTANTTASILCTPALSSAAIPRFGTIPVTSGTLPTNFNPETGITKTVGGFPLYVTLTEWT